MSNMIPLPGCGPEPLIDYLKSLGVMRLVTDQRDSTAKAFWRQNRLVLQTNLTREELVHFFVEEYVPTPVLSPWNNAGGFYLKLDECEEDEDTESFQIQFEPKGDYQTLRSIRESTSDRYETYRVNINRGFELLHHLGRKEKVPNPEKVDWEDWSDKHSERYKKYDKENYNYIPIPGEEDNPEIIYVIDQPSKDQETKYRILSQVRSRLSEDSIRWADAACNILDDSLGYSPLLVAGGCEGRTEFAKFFQEELISLIPLVEDQDVPDQTEELIKKSLFNEPTSLKEGVMGQFAPASRGGTNAGEGFSSSGVINSWDIVLMIEGSLLLTGSASRKYGSETKNMTRSEATFPFSVSSSFGGGAGLDIADRESSGGELWMPIWKRPASLREIEHVFGEGRAEVNGQPAEDGVDFSRAVASLQVDRGIEKFYRYSIFERFGQSNVAISLDQMRVAKRDHVDLIQDIDFYLDCLKRRCHGTDAVATRYGHLLTALEDAIVQYCKLGTRERFQEVLKTIGRLERETSQGGQDRPVPPVANLSPEWVTATDDGSFEFRLAASVASMYHPSVGPIRKHMEPVGWNSEGGYIDGWEDGRTGVAWEQKSFVDNLGNLLLRRTLEGEREDTTFSPLRGGIQLTPREAHRFLEGEFDGDRTRDLLWGLITVRLDPRNHAPDPSGASLHPDHHFHPYNLLKLCFLPGSLVREGDGWTVDKDPGNRGIRIRSDRSILKHLHAGRMDRALNMAADRLRVSGLIPRGQRNRHARGRFNFQMDDNTRKRLLASLLLPVWPISRMVEKTIYNTDSLEAQA